MSEWFEEVGIEKVRRAHGHGLYGWLLAHARSRIVFRVYWALQPLRCRLGYHDWYSTAAGECSACVCGADESYPRVILWWSRDPIKRLLASRLMEAEYSRDVAWQAFSDVSGSDRVTA